MKPIVIYILMLVVFSMPGWWLGRQFGGTYYIVLMMYGPALAAIASTKLLGRDLSVLGWRGTKFCWPIIAWATPVIVIGLANIVLILGGITQFPNADALGDLVNKRGMADWPLAWKTLAYAILVFTVGIVGLTANALGEEVGWRGYLTAETYERWGFTGSSLFVGALWAIWHLPLFVGRATVLEFLLFALSIVAASFAYTWVRLASRSVWPAVIMHGTHNTVLLSFWDELTLAPPDNVWAGESGYAVIISYWIAAILFWMMRHRAEQRWGPSAPNENTDSQSQADAPL